ncbi:hypothetical protein TNCV_3417101 [Trichonephila clavipes]|nr:hypothetical protein TNCV_3417101 [Trichonephila clavipes]
MAHHLQGRQFKSEDEAKSASQAELKDMAKNGFQKCFDELYKLWQKCTDAQGSYFEGVMDSVRELLNPTTYIHFLSYAHRHDFDWCTIFVAID